MSRKRIGLPLILACIFAVGANAAKTAVKIDCASFPPAVASAAAKYKTKPGTNRSCEKIEEDGHTFYELKIFLDSGKMSEIVFRPDGTIEEVEEESDLSSVPPAVREALQKALPGAELAKVDIIRHGAEVLYEGEYRKAGAKHKVIVDKTGKRVK